MTNGKSKSALTGRGASVTVGDTVYVVRASNDKRRRLPSERYIEATVTDVKRAWITVMTDDGFPRECRFRLDTQNDGSQYLGDRERFVTPQQREQEEAISAARALLREQKITFGWESPWAEGDGLLRLADAVRALLAEDEANNANEGNAR